MSDLAVMSSELTEEILNLPGERLTTETYYLFFARIRG
jgi:hypothetical protein